MKLQGAVLAGTLAVLTGLSVTDNATACAGCSNPNLPAARGDSHGLTPGEVSAALSLTGTTMRVVHSEECPDIGPICDQRDEPPQLHDLRFYVAELRPILAVGLTGQLALEAQLPMRVVHTRVQFRRLDGTPFEPDYQNIHHRNETIYGMADPWLLGRVTGSFGRFALTTRAGVGLPVGSTEEDPFVRGRAGLPHQHIQLGTGTVHPVFGLDLAFNLDTVRLGAYGQVLYFLYENRHGYRPGSRYLGGLTADTEVSDGLRAGLGADLANEQPERWQGEVYQDGNVGRTDLLVGGMLSYTTGSTTTSLSARFPVWQHFVETGTHGGEPGQLTYPVILGLSVASSFGAPPAAAPPPSGVLD